MSETQQLNPMALSVEQAARVLSAAGWKPVTVEMVKNDIEAGAPTNPDGTLNLMHYAAWLCRQLAKEMGRRAD